MNNQAERIALISDKTGNHSTANHLIKSYNANS